MNVRSQYIWILNGKSQYVKVYLFIIINASIDIIFLIVFLIKLYFI